MARPWRDIIRAEVFEEMIGDKEYMKASTAKDLPFKSREAKRKQILDLLREYHKLEKDALNNLTLRQALLYKISGEAARYLEEFKVDMAAAKARVKAYYNTTLQVTRKMQTTDKEESFDRNMLTLKNRAERKAQYLGKLKEYCDGKDPKAIIAYVSHNVPQDTSSGLLGVHQSNNVEVEDFAHRDGFDNKEEGGLYDEFQAWLKDGSATNTNFFLWLEKRPICTSANRQSSAVKCVTQVEYNIRTGEAAEKAKFQVLAMSGGATLDCKGTPFDTYADGYSTAYDKSIKGPFALGLAAFVWTQNNDLFIAQHRSGKIHHSSLAAGDRVKCAGMIGIKHGQIEELSNNSGHYKPGRDAMRAFVLYYRPAFSKSATINVTTGQGVGYHGDIEGFLYEWKAASISSTVKPPATPPGSVSTTVPRAGFLADNARANQTNEKIKT